MFKLKKLISILTTLLLLLEYIYLCHRHKVQVKVKQIKDVFNEISEIKQINFSNISKCSTSCAFPKEIFKYKLWYQNTLIRNAMDFIVVFPYCKYNLSHRNIRIKEVYVVI